MNVTILHTEDCPNLVPLLAELQSLIGDRADITLTTMAIRSGDEALPLGFHGSPTILIDGTDPFPAPPEPVGLSCRSYPCCTDAVGRASGYPTRERLAEVLQITS